MPRVTNGMKAPHFSGVELKVQAIASREADKQLLRVPWSRFRRAYEEYPRWHGLMLWSRAVIAARGHAPSELLKTIRERCPGFLEREESAGEPNLLALHLLEWVHSARFGYAKRQGWLGALTFYGVRHIRSQAHWAFWERCENEWTRVPPKIVPSFEEWEQRALETKACDEVPYSAMVPAIEKYIDWEATIAWAGPLLAAGIKLPTHFAAELERRLACAYHCPGSMSKEKGKSRSVNWRSLIRATRQRLLPDATSEGCVEAFMEWIRSHPRHLRLAVYGKLWTNEQPQKQPRRYPSFRRWQLAAEHYVARDAGPLSRVH